MKRILIDGRFVGIGDSMTRYVLETLNGILKLDQDNQYTLLIRPEGEKPIERYPGIINAANLKVDIVDIPHYSFAEQTKLLKYLNKEKFDLVHFIQFNHPLFYKGNYVVTIHDLTMIGHLHYHNFIKQYAFNKVMKSATKDSKKIITISNTTKDDVIDYFDTPKEKFAVIYLGIDHERYNQAISNKQSAISSFKEKYQITDDYILYTGMWKKHKNLIRLFKAYEKYLDNRQQTTDNGTKNFQLVLTGKIDKNEPEVLAEIERINKSINTRYQIPNTILTTGFIEENELPIAYSGASLYAMPSLSEGFGWPPLEAMACGVPVISSKLSCMPEILGDAPYYFDPYKIDEIAKAIEKVLTDDNLRKSMIEKGLAQAKKYNWAETASETLKVYHALL
jgi:glycosyltransferase involved in cell wall biosynthesis